MRKPYEENTVEPLHALLSHKISLITSISIFNENIYIEERVREFDVIHRKYKTSTDVIIAKKMWVISNLVDYTEVK